MIIVQNLAVLLLTPVYVNGTLAEEKERRTLDLLFCQIGGSRDRFRQALLARRAPRPILLGELAGAQQARL